MADMCSALDKVSPSTRKRFFDGFPNILRNSVGRKIYRQFLQEYFEEENNITFWEMCDDLVEHFEQKDMDTRVTAAKEILGYAADMNNFINLDEMQLRRLREVISRPGQDGAALLETLHDVRNTVFDLLEERYLTFLECCGSGQQW